MPEHIFDEDREKNPIRMEEAEDTNVPLPEDLEYDWSDDMAEISGFKSKNIQFGDLKLLGIEYENDCRRMVEFAVFRMGQMYGDPPDDLEPKYKAAIEWIVEWHYLGDEEACKQDMFQALKDGSEHGATGAMVAASFPHAMLIWQFGWEKYKGAMLKYKNHPEMDAVRDFFNDLRDNGEFDYIDNE